MIPITIQGRKYKIKSIPELNTFEFIELNKLNNVDYVKYISQQTELPLSEAFFAVVPKSIEKAIGIIPDITKLQFPKRKDIDKNKTVQTVGQRHQIEACNKTGFNLMVFVLAVSQACSSNIDDVNKLYESYLKQPFTEILPAGFFFLLTLKNGSRLELLSSKMRAVLIKILNLRKLRALRS